MNNIIRFFVLLALAGFVIFFNVANLTAYVIFLIAILVLLIGFSAFYVEVRSAVGWFAHHIAVGKGELVFWLMLVFVCATLGFKYGAGEPIFLSTLRETYSIVNTPNNQIIKNHLVYGTEQTDDEMLVKQKYLKCYKNIYPLLTEDEVKAKYPNSDIKEIYNQCISNKSRYGVFVTNEEIKKELASKQFADFFKKFKTEPEEEQKSGRTWIFWKLALCFALIGMLRTPFIFGDWFADRFERLADSIRDMRDAHVRGLAQAASTQTTPTTTAPATGATHQGGAIGMFGQLYASDMAAEFTMKLFQGFAELLRRK
jgi:hypothetical protein